MKTKSLLIIVVVLVAAGVFYSIAWSEAPLTVEDTRGYLPVAADLADGHLEKLHFRTPGYPLILLLTGSTQAPTRGLFYLQLVMYLAAILMLASILLEEQKRAWLTYLFVILALLPPAIEYISIALPEITALFFITSAVFCFYRLPVTDYICPFDNEKLDVIGWIIPGMRNLLDLTCPHCARKFYGDLPPGHGRDYPCLLDSESGMVFPKTSSSLGVWFKNWLEDSWKNRVEAPLPLEIETFQKIKRPILLNCLDTLYGHSVLKLLNAQFHLDNQSDYDLIILVPRFLRWMVPNGAAAIWTVDLPLIQGTQWNEWLAQQIHYQLDQFDECYISSADSHPQLDSFDIQRFTGVIPFDINQWIGSPPPTPKVTFIWREDRTWSDPSIFTLPFQFELKVKQRIMKNVNKLDLQLKAFCLLADSLRQKFPGICLAVNGLGKTGKFPDWVQDFRVLEVSTETEKDWCEQYAHSHVVVGIHGSNMLLPSAHAATVVDLMPKQRWANFAQDILMHELDSRSFAYRCRFIPVLFQLKVQFLQYQQLFNLCYQRLMG